MRLVTRGRTRRRLRIAHRPGIRVVTKGPGPEWIVLAERAQVRIIITGRRRIRIRHGGKGRYRLCQARQQGNRVLARRLLEGRL